MLAVPAHGGDALGTLGGREIQIDWKKIHRVEAYIAFTDQIIATDLGYMFNSVVA
jgi:hypothetical protein